MKHFSGTFLLGILVFSLTSYAADYATNQTSPLNSSEQFKYIDGNLTELLRQTIINDANVFKKMLLRALKNLSDYKEFPSSEAQINAQAFELALSLHQCTTGNAQVCGKVKNALVTLSQKGKFDDNEDQSEEASLLKFMRDRIYIAE